MLFRRDILEGLRAGTITLAFRRWKRPQVRAGSRLRTPVGVLTVESVNVVADTHIEANEARVAGFSSPAALLAELSRYGDGPIYRIALRFAGADPRLALHQRAQTTPAELVDLRHRLERLDAAARHGVWTGAVLRLTAHPGVRAADLAASLQRETRDFKVDVRKLKELELTESLEVGYRLSPRGRALLRHLDGGGAAT